MKRKRKLRYSRIAGALLIFGALVVGGIKGVELLVGNAAMLAPPVPSAGVSHVPPLETPATPSALATAQKIGALKLYSQNALLMRMGDGAVLLEKDADERVYPASLTKIMTVLLALEQIENTKETMIQLKEDIFEPLWQRGASMAGYLPGEEVRAIDLLYGALLPSGGECCVALAAYISGSQEAFVAKMNDRAQELGLSNTHFTNSTGLHDEGHYSSARDMARLLQQALSNDNFAEIFGARKHVTPPTNLHPDGITVRSTFFAKLPENSDAIVGGKTGYTDDAGLCLASAADIQGQRYLLVTLNAQGNAQTQQYHVIDAMNTYDRLIT